MVTIDPDTQKEITAKAQEIQALIDRLKAAFVSEEGHANPNPQKLATIRDEMKRLTDQHARLSGLLIEKDERAFAEATKELQTWAQNLNDDQQKISSIISDAKELASFISRLVEIAKFVGTL